MNRSKAIVLPALAAVTALALPAHSTGATTRAQKFFGDQIQADRTVNREVRANLKSGAWRIDRDIVFADLTGDDKSDAVVRVYSGTSAGDVALYVFSSKDDRKLGIVHKAEGLYRVTLSTAGGLLRLTVPEFKPGDATCCPSGYVERDYGWDGDSFSLRNTRRTQAEKPAEAQPGSLDR